MNLNKKYAIGTLVMFYEVELFPEHIDGIINTLDHVDNINTTLSLESSIY